ncbi:hypothetical protein DJ71_06465, partial [Halorubrum sp. E3]
MERDALRATVSVADGVPVEDRLVVEMPGAGRVRSPVTIDSDELLLLVPQYESGVARIALDALDAEERVRVPGNGTFTTPSSTGGRDRDRSRSSRDRGSERSRTDESEESQSRTDEAAKSRSRSSEATSGRDEAASGPASTGTPAVDRAEPSAEAPTEGHSASRSEGGPSLSVTRHAPDRAPGIGHAVRDRIVVENEGESTDSVEVALDDGERLSLGRLDRGETASIDRFVAAGEDSELALQSVAVEANGTVVGEVDARRLPVSDDAVGVVATVDPAVSAPSA